MKKFDNYVSHLEILSGAKDKDLSDDFIVSGIIDKFNIQFELGWKVLKRLLKYEGQMDAVSGSPRTIIRSAYSVYDFLDEEIWLRMLNARNDNSHIYDAAMAQNLVEDIINDYIPEFVKMRNEVEAMYGNLLNELD